MITVKISGGPLSNRRKLARAIYFLADIMGISVMILTAKNDHSLKEYQLYD